MVARAGRRSTARRGIEAADTGTALISACRAPRECGRRLVAVQLHRAQLRQRGDADDVLRRLIDEHADRRHERRQRRDDRARRVRVDEARAAAARRRSRARRRRARTRAARPRAGVMPQTLTRVASCARAVPGAPRRDPAARSAARRPGTRGSRPRPADRYRPASGCRSRPPRSTPAGSSRATASSTAGSTASVRRLRLFTPTIVAPASSARARFVADRGPRPAPRARGWRMSSSSARSASSSARRRSAAPRRRRGRPPRPAGSR